ncbi:MAG: class I SAM-dependent methyltransferase [Anaerolineales bacterium]
MYSQPEHNIEERNPMIHSIRARLRSYLQNISSLRRGSKYLPFENRSNYKETWNRLVGNQQDAYAFVAGHADEEELERSGQHTVEILEQFIGIQPNDVVLEIGCGVGRVGKLLSKRCAKWIGTDISGRMLAVAAERLQGHNNIELIELSTVGLQEIPDNSVDVVYCTVVFMHLLEWDRHKYIVEGFRVLRHGGRCFFDNVDITSEHGWTVFMQGYALPIKSRPAHLSMFSTGDELKIYAMKAGFHDVRIHRWDQAWVSVTGIKPGSPLS